MSVRDPWGDSTIPDKGWFSHLGQKNTFGGGRYEMRMNTRHCRVKGHLTGGEARPPGCVFALVSVSLELGFRGPYHVVFK